MKTIQKYVADDGTEFLEWEDCSKYEVGLKIRAIIRSQHEHSVDVENAIVSNVLNWVWSEYHQCETED